MSFKEEEPILVTPTAKFKSWTYLPPAQDTCSDRLSSYTMRGSKISNSKILRYRAEWKSALAQLGPPPRVNGRGAIYCVYPKILKEAIVSIQFLLESGWEYPIQVWHSSELGRFEINMLEAYRVSVYNIADYHNSSILPALKDVDSSGGILAHSHYEIKGLALLNTSLDEILYLDADNMPLSNPAALFDSDAYRETRTVFWKDFWKTHPKNHIWRILDIPCTNEFEQESGQLVFKKSDPGVWKALNLAVYMQVNRDLYFDLLWGDKDTFRLAWRAMHVPYHMVRPHVAALGYLYSGYFYGQSMVQYAPYWSTADNGPAPGNHTDSRYPEPMFVHANLLKYVRYVPGETFSTLLRYRNPVTSESHASVYPSLFHWFRVSTNLLPYMKDGVVQETVYQDFKDLYPKFDVMYQQFSNKFNIRAGRSENM